MEKIDSLTRLPSRSEVIPSLGKVVKDGCTLLLIDLDNFKTINQVLGYSIGDQLLIQVAKRLKTCIPKAYYLLARFAEDEFAIVFEQSMHSIEIIHIVEKISYEILKPFLIEGHEIHTAISTGIVVSPEDGNDAETLVRHASTALTKAQREKSVYQFFHSHLQKHVETHHAFQKDLRSALKHNEFSLYYQPQISLTDFSLVGAEALIRWQHPKYGFIGPDEFTEIAEKNGLILPIGEWVLRQACISFLHWQKKGLNLPHIAVNLSVKQLQDPSFLHLMKTVLHETKMSPQQLELEVTETTLIENLSTAHDVLAQIAALGVRIAIDDFGTGFSSLNYLKELPINLIKIDRTFIKNVLNSEKDRMILNMMIELAHQLNLKVLVEGIEHQFQLDYLTQQHCDIGQGFYFSKPLSEVEFIHEYQ